MVFFSLWNVISRKHSHKSVDYPYYILQAHEVLSLILQMFKFSIFINHKFEEEE